MIYFDCSFVSYDPVDRIILEKNHTIAGRTLEVQKAQMRDGQSRPRPASLAPPPSRPIVHRYYSPDPSEYQQDTNFNRSNTNWTSFGQESVERKEIETFYFLFFASVTNKMIFVVQFDVVR